MALKSTDMVKTPDEVTYCLKTMCPNTSTHRSGYCVKCRTFQCPKCGHEHTIIVPPHSLRLRLCAMCRRSKKNTI